MAGPIADTVIAEELRRLGTSYDVTVISYGYDLVYLDRLPGAGDILRMGDDDYDDIVATAKITRIASGRERATLDWEHIRDLRQQSEDFVRLFAWISYCLEKKKPYRFEDYLQVATAESKYA